MHLFTALHITIHADRQVLYIMVYQHHPFMSFSCNSAFSGKAESA